MKSMKLALATVFASAGLATAAFAEKAYGPGVTDTEIKIGNIMPYSGPASAYGIIGKTQAAYFKMINDQGGINGRKINFISYDDAYSPPKTVEQARKLVESDNVLLIFSPLGTPPNSAIHKYMNMKKVPHLFLATGATKWNDPKHFPWTMGWQPNYQAEGQIYAKYILKNKPDAKIGILYQNDDYGKDYLKGFMDGLGGKIKPVVTLSYEVADPTIDSQMTRLQASGADTFFNITTPKFAAMAIKKSAEMKWKPLHFLNNVSASIGTVLKPAGFENSQGIISTAYMKDPNDPQWKDDAGVKKWNAFVDKYLPGANKADGGIVTGYNDAQTLVQVLKQCGDNLTRENVMKQAASLKNVEQEMLLPGIKINTSADDFAPIQQEQLERFKGDSWELFGEIYSAEKK
ncbi:MAG: ABC transporter substrate-binding protein [Methylobacteriaceae bacterium]|nr:ABC transporter substrate-binding protein [Rhodoblastus sp.]MCC0003735.1 ABC transporter substrate-binding protein [Methylobacteriaceae bacterium]